MNYYTNTNHGYSQTLTGYVRLANESGNVKAPGIMRVGIKIKSFMLEDSLVSDSSGFFVIYNVQEGDYLIKYYQKDHGTVERLQHLNIDTKQLRAETLFTRSTNTVVNVVAQEYENDPAISYFKVSYDVKKTGKLMLFADSTVSVEQDHYLYHVQFMNKDIAGGEFNVNRSDLLKMGFKAGDSIYFRLYGDNGYEQYDYINQVSYFPCLSTSSKMTGIKFK